VRRMPGRIEWVEEELAEGCVYLILPEAGLAETLLAAFKAEAPVATEEGKALLPESYLKGRRRTADR